MKALVLEALNVPLVIKDVPTPTVGAGEVLAKVKAAAFNHRDVWIQKGQYAGIKFPSILGSDGAGVVAEVGSDVSKDWLGKEVVINPSLNWGNNPKAQAKDYKILGLPDNGTFAEFVKVPASNVFEKPKHLSFPEAAAIPLAGLTGYRALFTRATLAAGEKVLVTGIGGGVALFVMQFAIAAGASVYVTSGSDEKINQAVALGAKGGVNYKSEAWYKTLQAQAGNFDVIIDSAAGDGFSKLIDLAAAGGRITFFGGTTGAIKDLTPAKIFWKQLSIFGSTMGTSEEFDAMLNFIATHHIKPVVDKVFPFAEAEQAMRRMDSAGQFGKIVLNIQD
jgi:zinc-binding alcohol dehydrogenase/oxidoreductase